MKSKENDAAIAFHLDGPKAEGTAIPAPNSPSSYVEIPAQRVDERQPDAKDKLKEEFAAAKVAAEVVYQALHG